MDVIDEIFSYLSNYTKKVLPEGVFTRLLAEGIITGIGGVIIFIPQIAFLFMFIFSSRRGGYESSGFFV